MLEERKESLVLSKWRVWRRKFYIENAITNVSIRNLNVKNVTGKNEEIVSVCLSEGHCCVLNS